MNPGMPHFLLFAETGLVEPGKGGQTPHMKQPIGRLAIPVLKKGDRHILPGRPTRGWAQNEPVPFSGAWRFVLRTVDGIKHFEAADIESEVVGERLDLLTLVRALESLDQPSRVTLVGSSNYIRQGIQYGMPEWRMSDWQWEWFGQLVPVKNADLWQRLDRLMAFHQVECRLRRTDGAHPSRAMPNYIAPREMSASHFQAVLKKLSEKAWDRLPLAIRRSTVEMERKFRDFAIASAKAMRNLFGRFLQRRRWGLE
jgi:ribonuclease HI